MMANSLEFAPSGHPIEDRFDDYGCDSSFTRDLSAEQYAEYIESSFAEPTLDDMIEVTEALLGCPL